MKAKVYAMTFQIYCPHCIERADFVDPIPAPDGSFVWEELPERVECPMCRKTFPTPTVIRPAKESRL